MRANKTSVWARLFSLVLAFMFLCTGSVLGLSDGQKKIYQQGINYFDLDVSSCSADGSTDTTGDAVEAVSLQGSGNDQKAYNFYVSKGFTPQQSAAIVGNLIAESGVNPKSNQTGGAGKGIAQWGDRFNTLTQFAAKNNADPYALSTQLSFTIQEFNGDYKGVMDTFKKQSNISDMTAFFMGTANAGLFHGNVVDDITNQYIAKYGRFHGYEDPGSPHLDNRIGNAKGVLQKYGGGAYDGTGGSTGADSGVSGTDAGNACGGDTDGQSASVDCTPTAATSAATSTVTPLRQKVVCLVQGELALWTSGQMKAGTDFWKYSGKGNTELWCADFASWIYNQAGYPIGPSAANWRVPAVSSILQIGQQGNKFVYHAAGNYTPKPGDMIIHKDGESHVNFVISVNVNNHSMVTTGGDQHGSGGPTGNVVNSYTVKAFSDTDGITGYVSPKEN